MGFHIRLAVYVYEFLTKQMAYILSIVFLLLAHTVFRESFSMLYVMLGLYLGFGLYKIHPLAFIIYGISLIQCFYMNEIYATSLNGFDTLAVKHLSSNSFSVIILFGLFVVMNRRSDFFLKGFLFTGVVQCLATWYQYFLGVHESGRGGFLGNPSMSACFMAMVYPLVFSRKVSVDIKAVLTLLFISSILLTGSAMGVVGLLTVLVALVIWMLSIMGNLYLLPLLVYLPATAFISYILIGNGFDFLNDRDVIWQWGMGWLYNFGNLFTGMGPSSSKLFLPYIQNKNNGATQDWFISFHNDWLQIIFENGIFVFLLCILLYFISLKKALDRPHLFTCLLVYGVIMIGNFPLHWPLTAFFGLVLFTKIMKDN